MNANILSLAAAVSYGAVFVLLLRKLSTGPSSAAPRPAFWLLAAAVLLHAAAVWFGSLGAEGVRLGITDVASMMLLIMSICVIAATQFLPVANLQLLVAPVAALVLLIAALTPPNVQARSEIDTALAVHIAFSVTAYGVLMLGALQAMLLTFLETGLRNRDLRWVRLLPPLETMEQLLFSVLWLGLGLLVLAIATGFLYLDDMFAQRVVHHTVLAIAAASAYATLLLGRQFLGWRSTTAIRWVIVATVLLLLGYFGSKFVLEIILERTG